MMSPEERQLMGQALDATNERFEIVHTSLKTLAEYISLIETRMNALERIILSTIEGEKDAADSTD